MIQWRNIVANKREKKKGENSLNDWNVKFMSQKKK